MTNTQDAVIQKLITGTLVAIAASLLTTAFLLYV